MQSAANIDCVPSSQESLDELAKGVKIIRLKTAAYWIDYVALRPSDCDWLTKQ